MPRLRIRYARSEKFGAPPIWWWRAIFFGIAIACFGWVMWTSIEEQAYQSAAAEYFGEELQRSTQPSHKADPEMKNRSLSARRPGRAPMAHLEIERVGVSGWVQEGVDGRTLRNAIGHSPSSARPGERGNIVLAAHRDTFFTGLREARTGDSILLRTSPGITHRYRIFEVFVVNPEDVWVMDPTPGREVLTLITCYPFRFVGAAPQRLIVRARPVEFTRTPPQIARY